MPRQAVLDFDAPAPDSYEATIRRHYLRDGEAVPDWLKSLLATIRLQEVELERPDPLTVRVPVVGDHIEVLWRGWINLGWTPAVVTEINYPQDPFLSARVEANRQIWTQYVSRRDWAWQPLIEKGPLWRWPS